MASLINLSFVSLIYRTPTGEPKWGEGKSLFLLPSPPVKKSLEGGSLPEIVILKEGPPWPRIWQKGTSISGNMVSEFLGQGDGSLQRRAGSEPAQVSSELAWRVAEPPGSGRGGLTPPLVTPSRPRHGAGPPRSFFSKIRHLTVCIPCSSLLNGSLVFLIFKIIGDSSEGGQFYLSPKLCIYIYFHPRSPSTFVTLIRVF